MTVVDFHPDDLLDRDARGLLAPDERVRLSEHLKQCTVCRLELQLRADFRAEFAPYEESASMQRFVLDALSAANTRSKPLLDVGDVVIDVTKLALPRPSWRRKLVAPLAATLLFVTGLAAAQQAGLTAGVVDLARRVMRGDLGSDEAQRTDSTHSKGAHNGVIASTRAHAVQPESEAQVGELNATADRRTALTTKATKRAPAEGLHSTRKREQPAASKEPLLATQGAVAPSSSARPIGAIAREVEHASQEQAPKEAPVAVTEATQSSAAARLFAQANIARRQGRWLEASALYRELRARYVDSPESRLSLVVLARMQLDQGEAGAALRGFDAYLASAEEALREEALTGRCMALQKLGRTDEERVSVRRLLASYPDSPYARKAAKRLGAELNE